MMRRNALFLSGILITTAISLLSIADPPACPQKCVDNTSCIVVAKQFGGTLICAELEFPAPMFVHTTSAGEPDYDGQSPVGVRGSSCTASCDPVGTPEGPVELAEGTCGGGNDDWSDGRSAEECRSGA